MDPGGALSAVRYAGAPFASIGFTSPQRAGRRSSIPGATPSPPATSALEPEAMSRRLAPHLEGRRVVAARVIAVAPERRVVVAYDTAGPLGPGPRLIGKVYAEPGRARRVHALLQRLEEL